jgi:hypothetical protein
MIAVEQPAAARAVPAFHLQRVTAFDGVQAPVFLGAPRGDHRIFVVEQQGRIMVLSGGHLKTFLDIRASVLYGGERGLLSVAFHPDFAHNHRLFVYYTARSGPGTLTVDEFVASGDHVTLTTRRRWVTIRHADAGNHNGGQLQFGPDGRLWMGTGDGGQAGDSLRHAQDVHSLLGKILRINVNVRGARPSIWAIGVRNPWRFSFDRSTHRLWIGDVGQNAWEEVDRLDPRRPGLVNLGWGRYEGRHLYNPARKLGPGRLTWPVAEVAHPHSEALMGGYVYRGPVRSLKGYYLYSDNQPGDGNGPWLRGLTITPKRSWETHAGIPAGVTSFGEDGNGDVYLVSTSGIFKFAP